MLSIITINLKNTFIFLAECNYLLGSSNDPYSLYSLLQYAFTAIKLATPCIVFVLIIIDFTQATTAQDEKQMKLAYTKSLKRLIAGLAIFFTPTLLNIILNYAGLTGTCNINWK